MTQRCLKALARSLMILVALATTAGAASLSAQTGKIQGYVRDANGAPLAANVLIVGTAFSAPTNAQGYYFIENIPAGIIAIRATAVGYQPKETQGYRVLAGQTGTLDFSLPAQTVTLQTIEVTTAKNALVPRDEVTTKQTVTGEMVRKLPTDRIEGILALTPGAVQVSTCTTNQPCEPLVSVRGGRVDQNALYIDGIPVIAGIHTGMATSDGGSAVAGAPQITIATNGFEQASATTGATSAEFGNGQASVLNISTPTGSHKFAGNIGYETGLLGGARYGQGLNTFSGSLSGPIAGNLTFFVSGSVEGFRSNNGGNHGWLFPGYSAVGIDTVFRIANGSKISQGKKAGVTDSVDIPIYQYAVTEGGCDAGSLAPGLVPFQNSSNPDIASNYGAECHSNQSYRSPSTNYFTVDKLNYTFGQGSRLSLSYLFSGNQNRGTIGDGSTGGGVSGSNVATLSWNQTLIRSATHQLSIEAAISRQWNNSMTGRLTPESEQATRSSPGGFIYHKLDFQLDPKDFPVDSTLIYNVLLNRDGTRIGLTDPKNTGQYNGLQGYNTTLPPDGVGQSAGGGGGEDIGLSYDIENRWVGKANIDFQLDQYNRIKVGGEYTKFNITDFQNSSTGSTTFKGDPVQYAAFAEDRIDLGDVIVVGGARYDYYWSRAWRWNGFPQISSRQVLQPDGSKIPFNPDSLFCPEGTQPSIQAVCALVRDPSHNYLSPHLQVSFPVNEKTNFRLSYAQNVQPPDFGLIYTGSLSDINTSGRNSRSRWGQDLDFGKTVTFEFGARHAFSEDMVLDVAVYNNDIVADPTFVFEHPINPTTHAAQVLYEVKNTDFGNTRGIDVRLDRRIGNYFNGTLAYSFQDSKNTGTDPFSYLGFFENISGYGGTPATAALPTGSSRPHSLSAVFSLQLPADWERGNILGTVFNRTSFNVTARIASGLPYTRCDPKDQSSVGVIAGPGRSGQCGTNGAVEGFNASRLPSLKTFDMKVTKDFNVGRLGFTAYLDARNILNLRNIVSVYAQTGTTQSGAQEELEYKTDSTTFATFGKNTGLYRDADNALVLPSSMAGCAAVSNGSISYAPECGYYIRSEQRFGNGDGVYTLAEQRQASNQNRAFQNSVWNFVTGARTIRFGLEVNF